MRKTVSGMSGSCFWFVISLGVAVAAGCGDDAGGSDSGAGNEPDGMSSNERCPRAGLTETGCVCSAERPLGSRSCNENLRWSTCVCGEAREENECDFDGQIVLCNRCLGETEGRMTTCQDNRFDCSCPAGDAGMGQDAAAMTDGG